MVQLPSMICQHAMLANWLDWTNQSGWQQMHIDKQIKRKGCSFCCKMNCDAIKCIIWHLKSTLIIIFWICDLMHFDAYDAILQFPIVLTMAINQLKNHHKSNAEHGDRGRERVCVRLKCKQKLWANKIKRSVIITESKASEHTDPRHTNKQSQ